MFCQLHTVPIFRIFLQDMVRTVVVVLFILVASRSFGQGSSNPFFFTPLNIENGLSQQTVNAIFQDADGYMWFATRNRLNRYDGYEFKIFRKNYRDAHSLCGNEILCITQDSAKDLWVGTIEGINRIDYETGKIFRYFLPHSNNIQALYHTSRNELFVFTNEGAWKYNNQKDSLNWFEFEGLATKTRIRAVVEDLQSHLYLGTTQGIYIYDQNYHLIEHIPAKSDDPDALPQGSISFMTVDRSGQIWAVTSFNKVSCWDPIHRKLYTVEGLTNVRQLLDFDDSTMLVGTFYGLEFLNKHNLKTCRIPMKIGEKGALSHYSVISLYKDRRDNLWVGTYSGGVNYNSKYNYRFRYTASQQFTGLIGKGTQDKQGNLWFATEGSGLLFYNPRTQEQQVYPIYPNNPNYFQNIIKSILPEGDDILCSTHNGQVFRFSIPEKKYTLLYDYKRNDINALYRDSQHRLWIPTNSGDGLVVMDGDKRIGSLNVKEKFPHLSPISIITEINKGQFLLGTQEDGLIFIDEAQQEFYIMDGQTFGFSSEDKIWITGIAKDPDGSIWVGTNGAGLFHFNEKLELERNYNKENGLNNECIYSFINQREALWLTTNREIYRLNKKNGHFDAFYSKTGFIPQEFSPYAAYCSLDGIFYFPSTEGFLEFDPKYLTDNEEAPVVLLTSLSINNKEEIPGKSKLLHKQLQRQKKLILPYHQTNITIGYTALNFLYSEQTNYAYRMEGVDKNWNHVGNRRTAFYSNLSPGEYKFRVTASNNRGVWNKDGAEFQIIVLSPLWFRWWAWCAYILIAVFVIYKIIMARHRKHELEASLLREHLEQKKLEEINQERMRFFTQVTHEFRTPLTLIINPLDDLARKYFHIAGIKEALLPIRKNADRLLSLVNSLMDLQKQNTGQENLKYSTFDFIAFLREIKCSFTALAEQRNIKLELLTENEILPVHYDREKLERLFLNLLSNACKFTPSGGTVTLSYQLLTHQEAQSCNLPSTSPDLPATSPTYLLAHVCDTGIGIPEDQVERIFDPFWHSDKDLHGEITGSGMGLSITKLIAEQHGGAIRVKKVEPTGTDMCIFLPYHPIPASEISDSYFINEQEKNEVSIKDTPNVLVAEKKRYRILLVEDNQDILSYISRNLSASYQIFTAGNGIEALEIVKKELPDMIVSDIMMPEMDGLELCRQIKQDIRLCHILVILLTARSMSLQMEEGFDAGADDYIVKPFRISLLQSRIRNLFSNREQLKEIFSKKFSLENLGIEVTSTDETFVKRYIQIVQNNFTNPKLDVDFICQEMGMSRANFYKKLHTVTDLSPMDMIRNIRLESAAQLLKESQLTISEITARVGFNSNSYFSTCFKALYGVSPKAYQANYDNEARNQENKDS